MELLDSYTEVHSLNDPVVTKVDSTSDYVIDTFSDSNTLDPPTIISIGDEYIID